MFGNIWLTLLPVYMCKLHNPQFVIQAHGYLKMKDSLASIFVHFLSYCLNV
jgi:hypothetical protein